MSVKLVPCLHVFYGFPSLFFSIVILYLRFGAQVLQDNFVAQLSTHYQNYILPMGTGLCPSQVSEHQEEAGHCLLWYRGALGAPPVCGDACSHCGQHYGSHGQPGPQVSNWGDSSPGAPVSVVTVGLSQHHADVSSCSIHGDTVIRAA